jgi:flagellar basal body-associated protein FliL
LEILVAALLASSTYPHLTSRQFRFAFVPYCGCLTKSFKQETMDALTSDDDVEQPPIGNTNSVAFGGSSNRSTSSWGKNSDGETVSSRSHVSEHDQLPNVEEIRMNAARNSRSRRSTVTLFIIATVVVIAAVVVAVTLVLTSTGTEDSEFPMEFSGNSEGNAYEVGTPTTSRPGTSTSFTNAPVGTASSTPQQSTTATSAPESREVRLINLLSSAGVSTMEALVTENSPQQKAVKWLADVDTLALDLDTPDVNAITQRYTVVVMYYSTGGESWPNPLNFLSGDHECEWFLKAFAGDQKTIRQYGITCNEGGTTIQGVHFRKSAL